MPRTGSPRGRKWVASLLGSLALLAGCASHQDEPGTDIAVPDTDFRVEHSLPFSPDDSPQTLYGDLYLPDTPGARPVVLMVHGGGWERRSRADMTWIAETLAGHGFAVFNIDYRFAPDYTFPAQLHDLQVARAWINRHAGHYRLDPDSVSGFGFSSGAHLVALLALVASSDSPLNAPHGGPDTQLKAAVVGGLPSDLAAFGSGKLLRQFLGGRLQAIPDTYRQASPITHIGAGAPPFFLFHGAIDTLVPFSQAEKFRDALDAHRIDNELFKMHLRGHVTSFLTAGDAVDAAIRFLARQERRHQEGGQESGQGRKTNS